MIRRRAKAAGIQDEDWKSYFLGNRHYYEANQHRTDREKGHPQAGTTMVAFSHGSLSRLRILGCNIQAGLNVPSCRR